MHHEHQEHQRDADVQQQPDRFQDLKGAVADPLEQVPGQVREVGQPAVTEVVAGDLHAPEEEHRPDHVEDHEQRDPRAGQVRALEPGLAAHPLGRVLDTDGGEDDQPGEGGQGDRVLDEADRAPGLEARNVRLKPEQQLDARLQVDGRQQEERPHHREVRGAGQSPLQQLALPEDLHGLALDGLLGLTLDLERPLGVGLAALGDRIQEQHPPAGERQSDRRSGEPNDQRDPEHCSVLLGYGRWQSA